nr:ANTAR domain-containing protein [Pseudarthrobacter psychrotolerans]
MAQNRCSQQDAHAILTRTSNHRNQKLRDVASELLENLTAAPIHTHFD